MKALTGQEKFAVKLEVFSGPIDLLLTLIEDRKLHIGDISLAAVTDDFISYVKKLGVLPLSEAADFLLVASTLLLIKSKSLLPALRLSSEEEQSIEELEKRLILYKHIRELARDISGRFGLRPIFGRSKVLRPAVFAPFGALTLSRLAAATIGVLSGLPKKEILRQAIVAKVVSLEEMINNLVERIQKSLRLSFREFAARAGGEKMKIIVGFLALLELVKRGAVAVRQDEHFSDIDMESGEVELPRYG